MTICKGVVQNNVVVLEKGVKLPEGTEVEVRAIEPSKPGEEVFARVLANRITRFVGIDEIIEKDKREREGK